jgi:hypothetical protein
MYVVPTPFRLVEGVAHQRTLILPSEKEPGDHFTEVGKLSRREADQLIVGYSFDLRTNELLTKSVPNPGAGREHLFRAWRLNGSLKRHSISMRQFESNQVVPDTGEE